jgi:hypothetical protein
MKEELWRATKVAVAREADGSGNRRSSLDGVGRLGLLEKKNMEKYLKRRMTCLAHVPLQFCVIFDSTSKRARAMRVSNTIDYNKILCLF